MNKSKLNTDAIFSGMKQLNSLSTSSIKEIMDVGLRSINNFSSIFSSMGLSVPGMKSDDCGCCPPKNECPPRCLTTINRTAYAGERIIVPFRVRNTCNTPRTYRVGIRELKDENGNPAPSRPILNKTLLTLDGGDAELVHMTLDLANFQAGHTFSTDIVLREKEINQNICFTLHVRAFTDIPEARPLDERKYTIRFQGWQSHFYCEPHKKDTRDISITPAHG